MVRLFSVKHSSSHLICVFLFLTLNSLSFIFYPKLRWIKEETEKSGNPYMSFSLDGSKERIILQYFKRKEQIMKRSSSRIVLRNIFQKSLNKTAFLIYEYTRYPQLCNRRNSASIYISACPFRNCKFTCNSFLAHQADAVLMPYNHLNYERLFDLYVSRNPDQLWLLYHDEPYPPASIYNKFLFNWTMSYRLDSEISVAAYGITFPRNHSMNQVKFNTWINENYKRRNEAVWFVSNCYPKERLKYYERLKEHFPISASGKCIINQTNSSQQCARSSQCELEKLSTSKFYLAFESTTLRIDYITEKFWRSLSLGAIPIVLGPKRQDYERVAPPNSFIYAKDYRDPQTLAKYLNHVTTNLNEYEKYHKWRINYETRYLARDTEPFRFCELCYKLNTNRDRIWYTDVNKYFLETDS